MSSERGKRILANCEIIWGKDTIYDLGEEGSDDDAYFVFVRWDFGTEFGPLLMFALRSTSDKAWNDLDRMLTLRAREIQNRRGQPSSPSGRNKAHKFGELTQWLQ